MKSMKMRIATGLGLLLFMATMIGGPLRVTSPHHHSLYLFVTGMSFQKGPRR